MERKISFEDVQKAVHEAFEQYKSLTDGTVDARTAEGADEKAFGISLMLTDGRTVNAGDTQTQVALGPVAKIPLSLVLLSQNTPQELAKKSCCCGCQAKKADLDLPFGKHGLRAVSAVVPQGDADGKFAVISDMVYALSNANQGFDDKLYKYYADQAKENDVVDKLDKSGYKLYDDAAQSVDVYSRLLSLKLSTRELAVMGATLAADGRNPITGQYAFDGKNAAAAVALMATRGKHFIKRWMVATGLPAKKSASGLIVSVLPGFGAIVAYAPKIDERGVSVKAAKAIAYIAEKLGLNVFASARVSVE